MTLACCSHPVLTPAVIARRCWAFSASSGPSNRRSPCVAVAPRDASAPGGGDASPRDRPTTHGACSRDVSTAAGGDASAVAARVPTSCAMSRASTADARAASWD